MIPLAIPNIGGEEGANLAECVATSMVSSVGPFVNAFEEAVGTAAGARLPAVATSAGTTGLHVALVAAGVGRDDLVFAPSLTFIATANAISQAGAAPWLVDSTAESWTMDPAALANVIETECERRPDGALRRKRCGRRVAAIMPVYTMGHPPDMPAIAAIAASHGLAIVSDAAAAIGARINDAPIAEHGAAFAVFSFNGNKTITSGGGGALTSADGALLDRARHLTTTARRGPGYDHDMIGFNYRMTNLQAAVGCAQMSRLDAFLDAKRAIADRYAEAFASLAGVETFPAAAWARGTHWLSGVFAPSASAAEMDAARAKLRADGVDARPFWRPIHLQEPYKTAPCASVPVSEAIWERILPLPCSTHLTSDEQARVIDAVRRAFDAP